MTFNELRSKIQEVFPDFYVDWEKYKTSEGHTIRKVVVITNCIIQPQDDVPKEQWQVIFKD